MDNLPQDMTIVKFFEELYGQNPPGWRVIWTKQDKHSWWFPAANVSEAANRCREQAGYCDVYFGLGLQKDRLTTSKRGKATDVIAIPGLWLDVDCRGGTHTANNLPTFDEAKDFLSEFPLPPSVIVHSGGGEHAYWLFNKLWVFQNGEEHSKASELLSRFQNAFIALAGSRGWRIDNTSDLARVLRVPGTLNHKGEQPVPVNIISWDIGRRYGYQEIDQAVNLLQGKIPRRARKIQSEVQGDGNKADSETIFKRCAFLRHCRDDAASLIEPEWYAMVSIVSRADGGAELVHKLSKPYPKYNRQETDEKIQHALKDTGPFTCEKIRADFGAWCQECRERVTSPVGLGLSRKKKPIYTGDEVMQKDYGHACILAKAFDNKYRWAAHRGKWMHYDGKVWRVIPEEAVCKRAANTLQKHYIEQLSLLDNRVDKFEVMPLVAKIKETCIYARVTGALNFLKGWDNILTDFKEWDKEAYLLNLLNGTLNLKTYKLSPHDPNNLITKIAPVEYDPGAKSEKWQKHIERFLPNPAIRKQVQRDVGLSLTGKALDELLPIWYGTGANGKTTTSKIILKILGDYAGMAAPNLLVKNKYEHHPTEIADLVGLRLVISSEIDQGKKLAETLVKQLTGGDKQKGRFMRQDFFEFEQTYLIFLITNYKPIISGTDHAIWRRIRLIPWDYTIPNNEKRPQEEVVAELIKDGSAILNWMIDGLRDWKKDRSWLADEVKVATEAYRKEMDILGEFIEECCILKPRGTVLKTVLYDTYTKWCEQAQETPITKKTFTQLLAGRGVDVNREGHGGRRYYIGIVLNTDTKFEEGVL